MLFISNAIYWFMAFMILCSLCCLMCSIWFNQFIGAYQQWCFWQYRLDCCCVMLQCLNCELLYNYWCSDVYVLMRVTATDQSVDYILQLNAASWAAGQEDHRTRLLMFLHSCQDESAASQPSVPWLPAGTWPQSCLFWLVFISHDWYLYTVSQKKPDP